MRRSYSNTSLIRSGAQRFGAAAGELRQHAQGVERSSNVLTDINDGWRGKGADAYRTVAEHLRMDIMQASSAFERAAEALNMLASQLDQVNSLYQQCEQLEHQLHALQAELWGADEERRERLQDRVSDLRYRLLLLEQQAETIDRQANNNAGHAFEQIATMANKVYFATHEVGEHLSAAEKVGKFFNDLWDDAEDKYEEITAEGGLLGGLLGFFEGVISSIIDTLEGLWNAGAWLYKVTTDFNYTKKLASEIFNVVTHPFDSAEALVEGLPDVVTVIWSTINESIDRDLINGNAYTRSKWAGYIVGFLGEMIFTFGVGEVGQGLKTVERLGDAVDTAKKAVQTEKRPIPNKTYTDAEIEAIKEEVREGVKNHPLRRAYEEEVRNLASLEEKLRSEGQSDEQIARTLYESRRELGRKYKDATPELLREYIYEENMKRYYDPLGGSFEFFEDKYEGDYNKIIKNAQKPNPDIDAFLSKFGDWLKERGK